MTVVKLNESNPLGLGTKIMWLFGARRFDRHQLKNGREIINAD
jgi:hypothetical protein